MKYPLSVIIIARNEERMIQECLESVRWADDIIVIDALSRDRTTEIARNYTERVIQKEWTGYVSAKQFGLELATNEWILWLDADERITHDLSLEIRKLIDKGEGIYVAYKIPRKAFFLKKWIKHCGWYPGYVLRLFKKNKVRFKSVRVHEGLETDGPTGKLKHDILHYTDDDLYHYFAKFNRYTSLAAKDMTESPNHFKLTDLFFRPVFLFFKMYFLKRGFLDGIHGLILSLLSASYVFCKYSKVWEMQGKIKEIVPPVS